MKIIYFLLGNVAFNINANSPAGIKPVVNNNPNLIPRSGTWATNSGNAYNPIPKERDKDNILTVRTKQVNKSEDKIEDGEIIHKGISQRQFARSFTIADDVKVGGAELKDGLLTINCERIVPEYKKKKLIEIK